MEATLFGLPVDVLHVYLGPTATMRVKACSLVRLVNAAGPDMDQAETVTLFNDLCLLAPAALIDAPVTWHPIDADHIRGTFANGAHVVSAELTPAPEGAFTYLEFNVDEITCNKTNALASNAGQEERRGASPGPSAG